MPDQITREELETKINDVFMLFSETIQVLLRNPDISDGDVQDPVATAMQLIDQYTTEREIVARLDEQERIDIDDGEIVVKVGQGIHSGHTMQKDRIRQLKSALTNTKKEEV